MSRQSPISREEYEEALEQAGRLIRYFADYSKRTTQGNLAIAAAKPTQSQRTFLKMRQEARIHLSKY